MITGICIVVSCISVILSVICVARCKEYKKQDDYHLEQWGKCIRDLKKACEINDKIIKIAKDVNELNGRLINDNAELRAYLKAKEEENTNA